jgi:hypothetical protein
MLSTLFVSKKIPVDNGNGCLEILWLVEIARHLNYRLYFAWFFIYVYASSSQYTHPPKPAGHLQNPWLLWRTPGG